MIPPKFKYLAQSASVVLILGVVFTKGYLLINTSNENNSLKPIEASIQCSNDIQIAIENNDLVKVQKLLEVEPIDCLNEYGDTLLIQSLNRGHEPIATFLIKQGANIYKKDNDGHTALFATTFHGLTQTAEYLIANGLEVNTLGYNDKSPLMMAASRNHLELVKLLVKNGAAINAQDYSGHMPLTFTSSPAIAFFLLANNADPSIKNFWGRNAIEQFQWEIEDIQSYATPEMISNRQTIIQMLENH